MLYPNQATMCSRSKCTVVPIGIREQTHKTQQDTKSKPRLLQVCTRVHRISGLSASVVTLMMRPKRFLSIGVDPKSIPAPVPAPVSLIRKYGMSRTNPNRGTGVQYCIRRTIIAGHRSIHTDSTSTDAMLMLTSSASGHALFDSKQEVT